MAAARQSENPSTSPGQTANPGRTSSADWSACALDGPPIQNSPCSCVRQVLQKRSERGVGFNSGSYSNDGNWSRRGHFPKWPALAGPVVNNASALLKSLEITPHFFLMCFKGLSGRTMPACRWSSCPIYSWKSTDGPASHAIWSMQAGPNLGLRSCWSTVTRASWRSTTFAPFALIDKDFTLLEVDLTDPDFNQFADPQSSKEKQLEHDLMLQVAHFLDDFEELAQFGFRH
jgi:hypothetical protein